MNNNIIKLADFDLSELEEWLSAELSIGTPAGQRNSPNGRHSYRSKQIHQWLGLGAQSFDDMTNLPRELRAELASRAITGIPEIIAETRSSRDGTIKFGMKTIDNCIIESVLMRYRHGFSVCVSSQAGCRMGCAFCATKPKNFARNLSPGEMFGQAVAIARHISSSKNSRAPGSAEDGSAGAPGNAEDGDGGAVAGKGNMQRISNVVVMGIGEPFDNYENTLKFIKLLHLHDKTGISYRKFTISTCGVLPGILRLAEEGLPIGLAVSLHAPNDNIRSMIMPVNRSYSIDKLLEGCKIYTYKTRRRVSFEYALMKGVNDAPGDAVELVRKIRGMLCHVNLIPVNKTENSEYMPSPKESIARFSDILTKGGINNTVRRELGTDIMAACGQLRNSMMQY